MGELRWNGQVAIVTGGGRGVGRCHARLLASRGARVVVVDHGVAVDGSGSSNGPADEVVAEIREAGGEATAFYGSVTSEADAAAMVETALDTFGRLDILVNNAGISDPDLFENLTTDQFRRMLDVQYLGTVYVTKAAWPHFMERGYGRIVNTCSEGPLGIHEMMTSYGGAKGGVIGFTLALAAEAPQHGIAVNGFSPRAATRMSMVPRPWRDGSTDTVKFQPELASPGAVYLTHESCRLNGTMLICGGGQVLRMAIMENAGFTTDDLTLEAIHAHTEEIIDMSSARHVGVGAGGTAEMPAARSTKGDH